jgi:hypothetical protein
MVAALLTMANLASSQPMTIRDPAFLVNQQNYSVIGGGVGGANGPSVVGGRPIPGQLYVGLQAYYSFDNSANFGLSATGVLSLTEYGTPGASTLVTGVVGGAVNVISDTFGVTDAPAPALRIDGSSSFTIAGWFKIPPGTPTKSLLFKPSSGSNPVNYAINFDSSGAGVISFVVGNTLGGSAVATVSGVTETNVWVYVTAWYDSVYRTVNLEINNSSSSSVYLPGEPGVTGSWGNFQIDGGGSDNCEYDQIGIWRRTLNFYERRYIYNGGSGRSFSDLELDL